MYIKEDDHEPWEPCTSSSSPNFETPPAHDDEVI